MKLNTILALLVLCTISGTAIAQKTEAPKIAIKPAAAPGAVKLPTSSEILEKYVKAIGGREAFQKHKSRTIKGTLELSPVGLKGTIESIASVDDKALTKVNLAGIGDILDGYDGKTAWTVNPIQGNRVKSGQELLQTKRNGSFYREINIDKLYPKLEVKGIEKIGDRSAYIVLASTEGLPDDTLYFDTETGLMLRSDTTAISPEGQQPVKSFYEDYRETEGIKTAHKVRAVTPQFEINTVITEIKYGPAIEDAKFVQPK